MVDSISRIPVVIVELQQPACQNVYGSSPCTAAIGVTGVRKCYNTRATCQDLDNYDEVGDPIILRFAMPSADIPQDINLIPSVVSAKTVPTRINIGGRMGNEKPLGLRAECSVVFADHTHSDNIVDPYLSVRDFDPLTRGTFWSKWLKRNPYNEGITIILYEGYAGQTLEQMQNRLYIVEKIEGPDSNNKVTLKATDILRLADNDKAKYPALTNGQLLSGISDADTSLTLTGEVEESYSAYSDYIRIGNEIIGYTGLTTNGSGDLEFTGLTRGQFGTDASAHDDGDTAQACAYFDGAAPWQVVRDVLLDAGVPSDYIFYDDWVDECTTWIGGLTVTNLLSEPMGVTDLVGQLCEQCSFFIWFDERLREIKLQAIKPAVGEVPLLTGSENLRQGKTSTKVRPELRASEVWISYLPRDYSENRDERGNFRRTSARVSEDNFYPERRVYELFSRWLSDQNQVNLLTFRLLARYKNPPVYVSFSLDAKDRSISVGDPFDIEFKGFTDETGLLERRRYQVISLHESPPGETLIVEAQIFDYSIDFKLGGWMIDAAPDYSAATTAEKLSGAWWADDAGLVGGDPGYTWS